MNEADAYRCLRVPVTAELEDIERGYLKQRAISEEALAKTATAAQRAEHEARLRKLELAYEIARGRVFEDVQKPAANGAVRRYRREIILGAVGILGIIAIGLYLMMTNKVPAIPELRAEARSSNKVHLAWNYPGTMSHVKGFVLYRKKAEEAAETALPLSVDQQRSYEDGSLEAGTEYTYCIIAKGDAHDSPRSRPVSITTMTATPKEPRIAVADPAESNKEHALRVKWTVPFDSSVTETRLERSDSAAGEWVTLRSYKAKQDPGEFLDTDLTADTGYWYRVVAVNETGQAASNAKEGRTAPEAPIGFKAVPLPDHSVKLTWQSLIRPESKLILRTASSQRELTAREVSAREVTEAGLEPGSTRQYVLLVKNVQGISSSPSATTAVLPPATPSGLKVKASGPDFCEIEWERAISGAKSFDVFRSENGQQYASLATVSSSEPRFVDKTVRRASSYSYKVVARNSGGASEMSAPSEIVLAVQPPPQPPHLVAKPGASEGSIQLSWTIAPKDAATLQKIVIERSTAADGEFKPIKEFAAPLPEQSGSTDQNDIVPGTEYFYRVQAFAQDYDKPFTSALESVIVKKQELPRAGPKKARPAVAGTPVGPRVVFGASR